MDFVVDKAPWQGLVQQQYQFAERQLPLQRLPRPSRLRLIFENIQKHYRAGPVPALFAQTRVTRVLRNFCQSGCVAGGLADCWEAVSENPPRHYGVVGVRAYCLQVAPGHFGKIHFGERARTDLSSEVAKVYS